VEPQLAPLYRQIEALAEAVSELTARVVALEQAKVTGAVTPAERIPVARDRSETIAARGRTADTDAGGALPLIGRTCLVLGGAFVLRALTEAGLLGGGTGVAAGLLYAAVFAVLADRAHGAPGRWSATFHGLSAVVISLPLLWEATVRLSLLSPRVAAGLLALSTVLILSVAWRQYLQLLAWVAGLGALATAFALLAATQAVAALSATLVGLGAASLWLTRKGQWPALQWPFALAGALAVAVMADAVARPGDLSAVAGLPSVPVALAVSLSLSLLYLGHVGFTVLARGRRVSLFEMAQTPLTLVAGFGGAVRVAAAAGFGLAAFGLAGLALAAGCYLVALRERRPDFQPNCFFCASLALVLALATAPLVVRGLPLVLTWCTVSLAAAVAARSLARPLLGLHAAAYILAASIAGGLPGAVVRAFAGPAAVPVSVGQAGLVAIVAAVITHAVLAAAARRPLWPPTGATRAAEAVPGLVAVLGLGALAVQGVFLLVSDGSDLAPPRVAAIRTAVLALTALTLALAGRHPLSGRLVWLAHPVLVIGGVKLVLEDLRAGGTSALVVSFACYGTALILVPRLRRWCRTSSRHPSPDPP
jgi:hypothetical protein